MLIGSLISLSEMRVKKIVAYRTLSQMGLCCMVYGAGLFIEGYINLIIHGFRKRALFIQVGYLIHLNMGQQDNRK